MTVDGLITVASRTGVKDTMDRLEADIITSGMAVFARIDHVGGASAIEMSL
jgi:uncharacterized protein (DUF302 family)